MLNRTSKCWTLINIDNYWFKVNCTLRQFAKNYTENTALLNKLADQTEDFAVQLIDQVTAKEELVIRDDSESTDRYASLLTAMTDDAIIHSQKKVGNAFSKNALSHPVELITPS